MDLTKYDVDGNPLNLMPQTTGENEYYESFCNDSMSVEPTAEDIKCELQLQALDIWEPLSIKAEGKIVDELFAIPKEKWKPYLRREGIMNNRTGIALFNYPGITEEDGLSMPEVTKKLGFSPCESLWNEPTSTYKTLTGIHKIFDYFSPVGRCYLVNVHSGGFFPPHKDTPLLNRKTFRIVGLLSPQDILDNFEWEMEGRMLPTQHRRFYYCDTRKTHRTHSWSDNCIHVIMNIPKTWENVIKLMSICDK